MNNFIELNLKDSRTSLSEIDNTSHLRPLSFDLRHFPDEQVDIPAKKVFCCDCGTRSDKTPIASNGYCFICNEINKHIES